HLHHIAPPTESSYRHATTNHFTQRGNVSLDVVIALRTGMTHTKTCHNFVKNQQAAVFIAHCAEGFQKTGQGGNAVHAASNWLDDDARNLLAERSETISHLLRSVVIQRDG